jgi:hypothetical protein
VKESALGFTTLAKVGLVTQLLNETKNALRFRTWAQVQKFRNKNKKCLKITFNVPQPQLIILNAR